MQMPAETHSCAADCNRSQQKHILQPELATVQPSVVGVAPTGHGDAESC
jgi:hypothetical protein